VDELEPLRGMRDYVGEEANRLVWLQDTFRKVVRRAGFQEIITPLVENFELFAKKGGEELRKTMYTFMDKGGREVTLRPEITPSAVRVYINKMLPLPKPVKIFYIGPVYRYDEPQLGRYREFRQGGVEVFGASGLLADIEPMILLQEFFDEIGIGDKVSFKLGNVGILREIMERAGMPDDVQERCLHLIDKELIDDAIKVLGSFVNQDILESVKELLISEEDNVKEVLNRRELEYVHPHIQYLEELGNNLKELGLRINLKAGFVRGLAYYTGPIFEAVAEGVKVSIAGGGRYDKLVELYGGPRTPAVGFAVGLERVLLATKEQYHDNEDRSVLILLDRSKEVVNYGLKVAGKLRRAGKHVGVNLRDESLPKLLSHYGELGYKYGLIVGKKEMEYSAITVRNLKDRTQKVVQLAEIEQILDNSI
jgi:histidyl-tRNA synthetase